MSSIPLSAAELITCCDTDRSARDANSVLSPSYAGEEITLIPPHPEWNGLTLGKLRSLGGPAIAKLARDQGLVPSEDPSDSERVRIHNLNIILKHLGVSCARPHPSSLNPNRPMVNLVSGPLPSRTVVEWNPPHVSHEKDKPLMTPVEVPLYIFLAYLTIFVYSNVVL